jgi:hypothetical protein
MAKIDISLSRDELVTICNALNEVLECVDDWEFETRLGRTKIEVDECRQMLSAKLDQMG